MHEFSFLNTTLNQSGIGFGVSFLVFLIAYFTTHGLARIVVCLVASYLFYGFVNWKFLPLLFITTLFNYVLALRLNEGDHGKGRKLLLSSGIVWSVGLLGLFKYFNFFADSLSSILGSLYVKGSLPTINVILPLGISFFTFQNIGYLIDVYRGDVTAERDFLKFATFVAFFPKIVAGPIVRAKHFLPQLRNDRIISRQQLSRGIDLVVWGAFLKIVVADSLAPQVDFLLRTPEQSTSLGLIIALFFFTFQIYSDFAGYSCIAIGLGRVLGFDLGVNFDRPYFASSFSEFWRKWHISLSSWIRDYIYVPLGGNRYGSLMTSRNLATAMTLCGLWHGASLNFAIWGLLHGCYLIAERFTGPIYARIVALLRFPRFVSTSILVLAVFTLTVFAWLFFRVPNFETALYILKRIAHFDNLWLKGIPNIVLVLKGFSLIFCLIVFEALSFKVNLASLYRVPLFRLIGLLLLLLSISLFGTFQGHSFVYAGF